MQEVNFLTASKRLSTTAALQAESSPVRPIYFFIHQITVKKSYKFSSGKQAENKTTGLIITTFIYKR